MTTSDRAVLPGRNAPLRALALALGLAAAVSPAADPDSGWKIARADYSWSFPRDHFAHDGYRTEWWYFTGHLESKGPGTRRLGYQVTWFRIGLLEQRPPFRSDWAASHVVMGHAALSDLDRREHRFAEMVHREVPLLASFGAPPDSEIARVQGPPGTDGMWTVVWNGDGFDLEARDDAKGFRLSLSTRSRKPLVMHGSNGYSRKGDGPTAASQYYSLTRLATRGTVTLDGQDLAVEGESWMDKEFGSSQLAKDQVGWDWFALRLDDGRDLMLYVLRDRDGGRGSRRGTVVGPAGEAVPLTARDFEILPLSTWTSRETGATYPSGWRVRVPAEGLDLEVVPDFAEQENVARLPRAPFYWEGSVSIRDERSAVAGRGYVELTGYGEGNRPPV